MIRSKLMSWREYLTPVTHASTFQTTGQITPEEFVEAGDYLCHMFPTWEWNRASNAVHGRDFLPLDRQFLVTRKVPCATRAEQLTTVTGDQSSRIAGARPESEPNDEWVVEGPTKTALPDTEPRADIDDMLEDMELDAADQDDEDLVLAAVPSDTRHYDLYIAYSTTYRVPKLYLVGFNSEGTPLSPQEMFQDIAPDYRTKTATIETLPFLAAHVTAVSIHPCKHANVMRVLMERVREVRSRRRRASAAGAAETSVTSQVAEDEWEDLQSEVDSGLRVDQYLIVFLKFIASVTPGIEHDYTMEGW
ncbi:LAME_0H14246g1_1 [Lachancea meyersii CBS 8951]|uniref:Autophagy-related protein 3 n=1 Tax=Lachancea meyersii CBS 8951 TaxID=1266667 RepID=A0A1G4KHP4_9SACH|nr:LAME_0H14246g1_1 [Lachancea meyersii CBS 8951]